MTILEFVRKLQTPDGRIECAATYGGCLEYIEKMEEQNREMHNQIIENGEQEEMASADLDEARNLVESLKKTIAELESEKSDLWKRLDIVSNAIPRDTSPTKPTLVWFVIWQGYTWDVRILMARPTRIIAFTDRWDHIEVQLADEPISESTIWVTERHATMQEMDPKPSDDLIKRMIASALLIQDASGDIFSCNGVPWL